MGPAEVRAAIHRFAAFFGIPWASRDMRPKNSLEQAAVQAACKGHFSGNHLQQSPAVIPAASAASIIESTAAVKSRAIVLARVIVA